MKRATALALILAALVAPASNAAQNRAWCKIADGGASLAYAPDLLFPSPVPPTDAEYAAAGWLANAVTPAPASNGWHVVQTRYEERDGAAIAVYTYAADPAPVFQYSKLRLIMAAKAAGRWNDLKAWIEAAGYEDEWNAAQNLASDYSGFDAIVDAIVAAGVATREEADGILEEAKE